MYRLFRKRIRGSCQPSSALFRVLGEEYIIFREAADTIKIDSRHGSRVTSHHRSQLSRARIHVGHVNRSATLNRLIRM